MTSHRTTARSILLALLGLIAGVAAHTSGAQTRAEAGGPTPQTQTGGPFEPDPPAPTPPPTPRPAPKPKPTRIGDRLVFPVVGPVQYTDDFGDPRPQGRHEGNDIMAPKRSLAVAVTDGTVKFGTHSSGSAGCYLYLYGKNKTFYMYIHLNNDLTKGNDNRGKCGPGVSYAKGLKNGQKVKAGEPIGFVGDSGDANGVSPHLHFEVHPKGGRAVDPYPYLNRAFRLLFALPRGSTFTLGMGGNGIAKVTARLQLRVQTVRTYPTGYKFPRVNRTIQLALPATALVERKTNGSARSVSPLAALKKQVPVRIWTSPAASTLAAQMGVAGALVAGRVLVLR